MIGVGIVKNKDLAFKLQKKLNFGQALTTPDGGLWRWDGFVQPPGVQNSYSERLQQIARLRFLQSEFPSLENNLSLAEKKLVNCTFNIKNCKVKVSDLQTEFSDLTLDFNNIELQKSKIEAKLLSSEILIKELENTKKNSQEELMQLEKEFSIA